MRLCIIFQSFRHLKIEMVFPNYLKKGTCKVRNEIETKRNETTLHFVSFRFDRFRFVSFGFVSFCLISFRFVRFRFVSFRFVSISFRTLQVPIKRVKSDSYLTFANHVKHEIIPHPFHTINSMFYENVTWDGKIKK